MLPYKSRSLATPEGEILAVLYFVLLMSPVNVIPVGMISLLKGSGRGAAYILIAAKGGDTTTLRPRACQTSEP